jgi:hypothetical protein
MEFVLFVLGEIRWGSVEWIGLDQNSDSGGFCDHGDEHLGSIKLSEILE